MTEPNPGIVMSSEETEGDRHDCCCEHVVDSLQAMSAAPEERYAVVRDRWYACPHREITPLEIYLQQVRDDWRES
jgi:hypothetical protein